jgi:hypothetical protein
MFTTGLMLGCPVSNEKMREQYLASAKEAEAQAAQAANDRSREAWLRIAFGYRDLARALGYQDY